MDVTKILSTSRAILDMQTTNETEAIEGLTNLLKKDGAIDCWETFIKDAWRREVEDLADSENHIVIPHGKSSAVVNTTLAVDRTRQDIPQEALDGSNACCIILFTVCFEDQNTTHVHLLPQVVGALADDDIIEQLLAETSPREIIGPFGQYAQSDVF